MNPMQFARYWMSIFAGCSVLFGATLCTASPEPGKADSDALRHLSTSWVRAVANRNPGGYELLSRESQAYYPRMRELALQGSYADLRSLSAVDQLQAMILRLLLEPEQLMAMSEPELLRYAIRNGLVGIDLRSSDTLEEINVRHDAAQGRLYKFGAADRPDRGLQYFVREDGAWRVDLRGELERLQADFDAYVARTGLSSSKAAFLILETRLMRKVSPQDFQPPLSGGREAAVPQNRPKQQLSPVPKQYDTEKPLLRLVAIRQALNAPLKGVATIEDRRTSRKYVLRQGESVPPYPGYILTQVNGSAVVFTAGGAVFSRTLGQDNLPVNARPRVSNNEQSSRNVAMLEVAATGAALEGMMLQWRNIGLRDRPHLLQQGWLTPEFVDPAGEEREMAGLKVRELTEGSFWQQLGFMQGDVIKEVNGIPLNSMNAWHRLMKIAEQELSITVTLERSANLLKFRTLTIRPR